MKMINVIFSIAMLFAAGCFKDEPAASTESAPSTVSTESTAPATPAIAPGTWTMNLDAAKETAASRNLPILLYFAGSDWCVWCEHVKERVFTKPEWKTYASENLVLVVIDFPKNTALIPERYKARNEALMRRHNPQGLFPTFTLLDSSGETIGNLEFPPYVLRNITPERFIEEINATKASR